MFEAEYAPDRRHMRISREAEARGVEYLHYRNAVPCEIKVIGDELFFVAEIRMNIIYSVSSLFTLFAIISLAYVSRSVTGTSS